MTGRADRVYGQSKECVITQISPGDGNVALTLTH